MIPWDRIEHFTRAEFQDPRYGPESGDLIDAAFLVLIVRLRIETGWPMLIHWAVGGAVDVDGAHGHADRSYHLKKQGCKAVDFHFRTGAPVRSQYYEVARVGFAGVGFYPGWTWNGKIAPGFHVDGRPKDRTQRWTRKNGEYSYLL